MTEVREAARTSTALIYLSAHSHLKSKMKILTNSCCLTKVSCGGQQKCMYQLLRLTQGVRSRGRFSLESGSGAVVLRSATWSSPGCSAMVPYRGGEFVRRGLESRGSARAAPALGPLLLLSRADHLSPTTPWLFAWHLAVIAVTAAS